ncbi:MAG: hypothetical protein ABIG34_01170 [Candidatus Peregrinibacteria bacterium]
MDTNTEPRKPSLLKQLLGAVGGAAVALLLYQAYKISAPVITAWIVTPQSQIAAEHPGSVRVNEAVSEYQFNRIAARAKEIYQRFSAEQGPQVAITPKGIEVTQPLAESSSSIAHIDVVAVMPQAMASASSVEPATVPFSSSSSSEEINADAASSMRTRSEMQAKLAGENLPSSGIGTTLAAAVAFGSAMFLLKKRGSR